MLDNGTVEEQLPGVTVVVYSLMSKILEVYQVKILSSEKIKRRPTDFVFLVVHVYLRL